MANNLSLSLLSSNKKLTDKETREICQKMNKENNPSEYLYGLKQGLINGYIEANVAIIELITNGTKESDLYPIAICLRYGANPNVYVSSTGLSKHIHILGFTYDITQYLSDVNYGHTLLALLMLDGAVLSKKIYDPSFGSINKTINIEEGKTVLEWLLENGFSDIKDIYEKGIENVLKRETLNYLHILLDHPEKVIFDNSNKNVNRNLMIIRSHGDQIVNKLVPQNESILWNNTDLVNAIRFLNFPALSKILNAKIKPTYPVINDLLLRAMKYRQLKLDIFEKLILDMIGELISKGIRFDRNQMSILSGLNGEIYKKLSQEYNKPFWRKECTNTHTEIPLKLKQLSIMFDIQLQDKDYLCTRLTEIAKRDPEELKSTIKIQKAKQLGTHLGWTEEFIAGNPPMLVCSNKLSEPQDEYSNIHMSSFRESDGSVWCFTSDQYETLISTGRNPYGGSLPPDYIEHIKFKLDTLKFLGLDPTKKYKIDDRIKLLNEPDSDENVNDVFINRFFDLLKGAGIAITKYEALSNDDIKDKLNQVNIVLNVAGLSNDHAKITYAWIIVWLEKHEHELYLQSLRLLANRKI